MVQTNLFREMRRVLKEERYAEKKALWMKECKRTKLCQLWEILFETDINDYDLLEERIYTYGSRIKETEYFHRDIFICLVAFLNLVIRREVW
ncbi:MAG: hypothetical protein IKJ16_05290 [Agathobacter sp.]|nr:hypothetical protein [Agathobacter sp.]